MNHFVVHADRTVGNGTMFSYFTFSNHSKLNISCHALTPMSNAAKYMKHLSSFIIRTHQAFHRDHLHKDDESDHMAVQREREIESCWRNVRLFVKISY